MSANLCWRPLAKKHDLPDALKWALRGGAYADDSEVTSCDRQYFQALADAKIDGAQEVLDAIDKYDLIYLHYEY